MLHGSSRMASSTIQTLNTITDQVGPINRSYLPTTRTVTARIRLRCRIPLVEHAQHLTSSENRTVLAYRQTQNVAVADAAEIADSDVPRLQDD